MLIEDFDEFVKSINDLSNDNPFLITEQEEETEEFPEVLGGYPADTCGLMPPEEEMYPWWRFESVLDTPLSNQSDQESEDSCPYFQD